MKITLPPDMFSFLFFIICEIFGSENGSGISDATLDFPVRVPKNNHESIFMCCALCALIIIIIRRYKNILRQKSTADSV